MSKAWRLLGSAGLIGFLAWRMDWSRVAEAFQRLDSRFWFLALALFVLTQGVSAWRWQLLAQARGLTGTWWNYLSFYFVGMFFNLVLPTSVGGDVVRVWYLAHQPGPDGRRMSAFLSVLADRVSGVAVLAVLAGIAALASPTPLPLWIWLAAVAVGSCAIAGVVGLPALHRLLHQPYWTGTRLERLRRLTEGGMDYLRNRRLMVSTTALSIVIQLSNVVVIALIGMGLGLPIPPLYYCVMVPLVTLLTLLPISVNGMGLREASTVLMLAPLGIASADAVTLSFLVFAAYAAAGLSGVGFYLAGGLPRFGKVNPEEAIVPIERLDLAGDGECSGKVAG